MGLTNAMGALSGALCDRFGVKVRFRLLPPLLPFRVCSSVVL